MSHIRFDEGHSDYEPSDSDDDYTENEKILLNKARKRPANDIESENEVYGVGSDEDDDSDIALSDVEGHEEKDDLPNVRAWGKNKRVFHSTDYVDPDYGGFQGKDAQLAEWEEEEARNLQQLLAQQLDDDDFSLDISTTKKVEDDTKITEEVIKSDISKLSKRQKMQILQKESPEFFGLVEDFLSKMELARDFLKPLLNKYKKGQISNCSAIEFVSTHYQLILNYCTNIWMYLLLKSSRVNVQNHPVAKRLYQYRQLLSQLEPVYVEIIKPQIELILTEETPEAEKPKVPKKTLSILSKLVSKQEKIAKKSKKKATEPAAEEKISKKVKFDDEVSVEPAEIINEEPSEAVKRGITYKMAKNKGLTPHRKKELRNPRVKHRNKFRKANIRRKGAVREPRTEKTRYGGEFSGIKSTVSKSIKIRT